MKKNDDFNWDTYTENTYLPQINDSLQSKEYEYFISENGLNYSDNGIEFKDNLHPNCKELYHIIDKLQPKSILECGCGGCFTLRNLEEVIPNAEIFGIDLSKKQLDLTSSFVQLSKKLSKNISVMDITKEMPDRKFDFVFTNAVIMHLNTDSAIKALNNIKNTSDKYVFLVENDKSHEGWYEMVRNIFIEWDMLCSGRFIQGAILLTKNEE